MSKIKIHKNFPRDFFTLLYNKLKLILKESLLFKFKNKVYNLKIDLKLFNNYKS